MGHVLSWFRRQRAKRYMDGLLAKGLRVGSHTHIMDGVFLDPAHCFLISIGDYCTLAPNVRVIAHDASMKKFIGVTKIARVTIHDHSFIGDSAIILPGVEIGPYSIIGSGAVVTRTAPAHTVVGGNPARILCTFDEFVNKHIEQLAQVKCFPNERYDLGRISGDDREQMLTYLQSQAAYMGSDPGSVDQQVQV